MAAEFGVLFDLGHLEICLSPPTTFKAFKDEQPRPHTSLVASNRSLTALTPSLPRAAPTPFSALGVSGIQQHAIQRQAALPNPHLWLHRRSFRWDQLRLRVRPLFRRTGPALTTSLVLMHHNWRRD